MTRARAHAQILLACLFVAGLGIRAYHLQDPPLDFHPTRQYHSAVIARGCYDRAAAGRSDRARRIAIANGASRPVIEPRIMEVLACGEYRPIREEQLWIPRFFSSLFWVIGAADSPCSPFEPAHPWAP
jgi:hypothetical protein